MVIAMKIKYVFASLIIIVIVSISFFIGRQWSDNRLLNKSEDEVYEEVKDWNSDKLIRRINRLEKKLPQTPEAKGELLPLYTALIEKADEFSESELIGLIRKEETLFGIESAFVKMYITDGYNNSELLDLINDQSISTETKEYIVANGKFSVDELSEIFRRTDGKTATIAIKRISAQNSERAMQLVDEFVKNDDDSISDEKNISICLGIAEYYEEHTTPEDIQAMKNIYIPMMKKIFEQGGSEQVKDQAIYALGRICDYDLFKWIIEHKSINKYTKISVAERNYRPMLKWIEEAKSEDDILAVMEAMEIRPTLEIADALEASVKQGKLPDSEELNSVIDYIRKNGIPAVDKY